ncbi:hypothetical protein B0H13DRAFT_1899683 [Mycena leptocephala]|nr:hypothetical protein B0H13DRAFT_1899683 [Mycena leptocephala]
MARLHIVNLVGAILAPHRRHSTNAAGNNRLSSLSISLSALPYRAPTPEPSDGGGGPVLPSSAPPYLDRGFLTQYNSAHQDSPQRPTGRGPSPMPASDPRGSPLNNSAVGPPSTPRTGSEKPSHETWHGVPNFKLREPPPVLRPNDDNSTGDEWWSHRLARGQ